MIFCERTLHSYYLLHINIGSYCQWCLDGSDSPDKQNFNKWIKHGKSESINYTLLNEKRIHDDEKKVHISCWIKQYCLSQFNIASWLMNLTHQVNTIAILLKSATLDIFCLSNITCINFDITYYLLPII